MKNHGYVVFQLFDQEGLRVEPRKLKVNHAAQFRMQPCRFVRERRNSSPTQGIVGSIRF